MKVIYADSFFLMNFAADYFLCLISARTCGLILKRGRYAIAAAVGGIYSVAAVLELLPFLISPPIMLAVAFAMGLICFGAETQLIRCTLVFLAISAAFGGAIWAFTLSSGTWPKVSGRVLLLSFAVCYAGVSIVFRGRAALPDKPRAKITATLGERKVRFIALVDTGNCLEDPLSGARIIVAHPAAVEKLFTHMPDSKDPVVFLEMASEIAELRGRVGLLPYNSVNGIGMLAYFRPDAVTVDGKECKKMLIAISANVNGDGYDAIL